MSLLVAALGLVVALLAILVVGLLRSHAEILRALHDLGVHLDGRDEAQVRPRPVEAAGSAATGSTAHDVTGVTAAGEKVSIAVNDTGALTLLAFLSTGCLTCAGFWRELATKGAASVAPVGARVVVVTQGPERESPAAVAERAPRGVTTVLSTQTWTDYGVPVAPYFVLVDGGSNRVVGEGAATSWERVTALLERAAADTGFAHGPQPSRREFLSGGQRAARADRALRDAGIVPGHPSLHPDPDGADG
ncbi:MAG: TlpA family protein disulfide reductase [Acidimicrobiales bacterium]